MILTGEVGSGKTSFVNNILRSRLAISKLPIHGLVTSAQLQTLIIDKLTILEKKSGQRLLGGSKKAQYRNVFFLDDLHSTLKLSASDGDDEVSSPVLELLRYMLGHGKLSNFMRTCEHLLNSRFVTVTTPGDYWRLPIRMTRAVCRMPFLPPSDQCLHQIFSRSLSLWLDEFPLQDTEEVADVSAPRNKTDSDDVICLLFSYRLSVQLQLQFIAVYQRDIVLPRATLTI